MDLILELVVEPQVQVEQVVEDVEQEEILLLQERLTLAVVVEVVKDVFLQDQVEHLMVVQVVEAVLPMQVEQVEQVILLQ